MRTVSQETVQEFRKAFDLPWEELDASDNPFIRDVLAKLRSYGDLSQRQMAAIVTALQREKDRAIQKATEKRIACPEGRQGIVGTVISIKIKVESNYRYYHHYFSMETRKMTLKCENESGEFFLCWGTVPQHSDIEVGDKIALTATFTQSDKDSSFAFFSHPIVHETLIKTSDIRHMVLHPLGS